MSNRARLALLSAVLLAATACAGTGATQSPSTVPASQPPASEAPESEAPESEAPASASPAASASQPATSGAICDALPDEAEGDLLASICEAGVLRVSTDPNYAPQSFQNPDGSFEGFDIDVATELAERLGVDVQFETPTFDAVVAGSWNERWDVSVGSVTITEERQDVLDFTQPYYYTPAQMAATVASGITDLEELAGSAICVGSSTTYQFWLEGTLRLVEAPEPAAPPSGATAFPLETDQLCAQSVQSGRSDFEGWLSSSTTVQAAIDAGTEVVPVGDPVFFEPLAVAVDKNAPDHDALVAELDRIVGEMHEDGTLTSLSEEWFDGLDLTTSE